MILRKAKERDVAQIAAFLQELTALGKRTRPDDEGFVRDYYVNGTDTIRCTVAEEDGKVLGFQSLKHAQPGNEWNVPEDWAIIGTHISPSAARRGVGRALFSSSLDAARTAQVTAIDASIGSDNAEGLGYYEAMGFRTYQQGNGLTKKRYDF